MWEFTGLHFISGIFSIWRVIEVNMIWNSFPAASVTFKRLAVFTTSNNVLTNWTLLVGAKGASNDILIFKSSIWDFCRSHWLACSLYRTYAGKWKARVHTVVTNNSKLGQLLEIWCSVKNIASTDKVSVRGYAWYAQYPDIIHTACVY